MRNRRYRQYKPSDIEWVDEIPSHWSAVPTKRLYSIQLGKMLQPVSVSPQDDEFTYLKAQHVLWERVRVQDLPTMWASPQDEQKYGVTGGDLLVCEGGDVGRSAVLIEAPPRTIIQNALHRVRPKRKNHSRFLMYVLEHAASQSWFDIICNKATIAHFTAEKFGALRIPLPDEWEQAVIVDFLDRKTAEIDALVAKKRALIEKLKEKRSALISRTVTRSLPPQAARAAGLEPNPKMKPSGIEWLGDVPEQWDLKQLKWAVTFQRGHDLPGDERTDGTVPLVSSSGKSATHSEAAAKAPGIVTGRYGTIGEFYLIEEDYWPLNTTLYSVNLRGNDPNFLQYMLSNLSPLFLLNAVKSAVPGVDRNDIHPVLTAVPPVPEQRAIADFLDQETAKIDSLVAKVEQAIERLQEYRTALITAAVTGKIDVRQEQSGLGGQSGQDGRDGQNGRKKAGSGPARRSVHA